MEAFVLTKDDVEFLKQALTNLRNTSVNPIQLPSNTATALVQSYDQATASYLVLTPPEGIGAATPGAANTGNLATPAGAVCQVIQQNNSVIPPQLFPVPNFTVTVWNYSLYNGIMGKRIILVVQNSFGEWVPAGSNVVNQTGRAIEFVRMLSDAVRDSSPEFFAGFNAVEQLFDPYTRDYIDGIRTFHVSTIDQIPLRFNDRFEIILFDLCIDGEDGLGTGTGTGTACSTPPRWLPTFLRLTASVQVTSATLDANRLQDGIILMFNAQDLPGTGIGASGDPWSTRVKVRVYPANYLTDFQPALPGIYPNAQLVDHLGRLVYSVSCCPPTPPANSPPPPPPPCSCIPDVCGICQQFSLATVFTIYAPGLAGITPGSLCYPFAASIPLVYSYLCQWDSLQTVPLPSGTPVPIWTLAYIPGGPFGTGTGTGTGTMSAGGWHLFAAGIDLGVIGFQAAGCAGPIIFTPLPGWQPVPGACTYPPGEPIFLFPACNCVGNCPTICSLCPSGAPYARQITMAGFSGCTGFNAGTVCLTAGVNDCVWGFSSTNCNLAATFTGAGGWVLFGNDGAGGNTILYTSGDTGCCDTVTFNKVSVTAGCTGAPSTLSMTIPSGSPCNNCVVTCTSPPPPPCPPICVTCSSSPYLWKVDLSGFDTTGDCNNFNAGLIYLTSSGNCQWTFQSATLIAIFHNGGPGFTAGLDLGTVGGNRLSYSATGTLTCCGPITVSSNAPGAFCSPPPTFILTAASACDNCVATPPVGSGPCVATLANVFLGGWVDGFTSLSVPYPSTIVVGKVLMLWVGWQLGNTARYPVVMSADGTVWKLTGYTGAAGVYANAVLYTRNATAADVGPSTVIVTFDSADDGYHVGEMYHVTNASSVGAFSAIALQFQNTGTLPSIPPTVNANVLFAFWVAAADGLGVEDITPQAGLIDDPAPAAIGLGSTFGAVIGYEDWPGIPTGPISATLSPDADFAGIAVLLPLDCAGPIIGGGGGGGGTLPCQSMGRTTDVFPLRNTDGSLNFIDGTQLPMNPNGAWLNKLMIAGIHTNSDEAPLTVPAGWTLVDSATGPFNNASVFVYSKLADSSDIVNPSTTYLWTFAADSKFKFGFIWSFQNAVAVDVHDNFNTSGNSSPQAFTIPALTPTGGTNTFLAIISSGADLTNPGFITKPSPQPPGSPFQWVSHASEQIPARPLSANWYFGDTFPSGANGPFSADVANPMGQVDDIAGVILSVALDCGTGPALAPVCGSPTGCQLPVTLTMVILSENGFCPGGGYNLTGSIVILTWQPVCQVGAKWVGTIPNTGSHSSLPAPIEFILFCNGSIGDPSDFTLNTESVGCAGVNLGNPGILQGGATCGSGAVSMQFNNLYGPAMGVCSTTGNGIDVLIS